MANFQYSALTNSGRLMTGTIEASSTQQAQELLTDMKLTVNDLSKVTAVPPRTSIGKDEFILFNQQLASITQAGIPLEKGLRELAADIQSSKMRKLINEIANELEAGSGIEQAFAKREKTFGPLYAKLLKAGVESGRLGEMLTSLNRHLEIANQTRRIVFEAMMYPAIIFVFGAFIVTLIFLLIIPQFSSILLDMAGSDAQLPALTRAIMHIPSGIVPFWLISIAIVILILLLRSVLNTFPAGRKIKEEFCIRVPVLGRLYYHSVLARIAEAMSVLIKSGSDVPSALTLAAQSSASRLADIDTSMLSAQLQQGRNILEAGQLCRFLPRIFLFSIALGSQRNQLTENLEGLGQMYSQQVFSAQARLQAVLLPVMLIAVGAFIGITVLGVFLPIIKIVTTLM